MTHEGEHPGGRPKGLDLFSGAGGASMGYHLAGFEMTGVDIVDQPHYPFRFVRGDALEYVAEHGHEYDFIAASPPCQHYANVTRWRGNQADHPDLLQPTIDLLEATGLPYVVENVPGAPMEPDLILCGSMFDLPIRRHRWFLTKPRIFQLMPACLHSCDDLAFMHKGERAYADAMGCDWMSSIEARQAIPPSYTRWIGERLLESLVSPAP